MSLLATLARRVGEAKAALATAPTDLILQGKLTSAQETLEECASALPAPAPAPLVSALETSRAEVGAMMARIPKVTDLMTAPDLITALKAWRESGPPEVDGFRVPPTLAINPLDPPTHPGVPWINMAEIARREASIHQRTLAAVPILKHMDWPMMVKWAGEYGVSAGVQTEEQNLEVFESTVKAFDWNKSYEDAFKTPISAPEEYASRLMHLVGRSSNSVAGETGIYAHIALRGVPDNVAALLVLDNGGRTKAHLALRAIATIPTDQLKATYRNEASRKADLASLEHRVMAIKQKQAPQPTQPTYLPPQLRQTAPPAVFASRDLPPRDIVAKAAQSLPSETSSMFYYRQAKGENAVTLSQMKQLRYDDTPAGWSSYLTALALFFRTWPDPSKVSMTDPFPLTPGSEPAGQFQTCDKCGFKGHNASNCTSTFANNVERAFRRAWRAALSKPRATGAINFQSSGMHINMLAQDLADTLLSTSFEPIESEDVQGKAME
ncbi:hypothetical protein RQP46_005270 [Phenoliferia psychrophenolica]